MISPLYILGNDSCQSSKPFDISLVNKTISETGDIIKFYFKAYGCIIETRVDGINAYFEFYNCPKPLTLAVPAVTAQIT
jgi:hypothetical protein